MDDDDISFADPQIRLDYEAALGRFILAFNEVDFRLSNVISAELARSKCPALGMRAATGKFWHRLNTLEIISAVSANGEIHALPIDRLRAINGVRNSLAHGYFDQNPFDGSYHLQLAAKVHQYPASHIVQLADELDWIAEQFRHTEMMYCFNEVVDEDDDSNCGASPPIA